MRSARRVPFEEYKPEIMRAATLFLSKPDATSISAPAKHRTAAVRPAGGPIR